MTVLSLVQFGEMYESSRYADNRMHRCLYGLLPGLSANWRRPGASESSLHESTAFSRTARNRPRTPHDAAGESYTDAEQLGRGTPAEDSSVSVVERGSAWSDQ